MLKRTLPLLALLFVACGGGGDQFENYCVGVNCGTHGTCAVGGEGPICVCDVGFTVRDGICKESPVNDPCKGIECKGNGVCAVVQGETAVCYCRPGYHSDGAKCIEDDVPRSPCIGVTCGGHGSCVVTSANTALCICDQGFHLEGSDCVATTGPCSGVDCGANGFV